MTVIDTIEAALREGRTSDAVTAAQAGGGVNDPDALAVLAHWHLVGSVLPRDVLLARQLLGQAAALGNADAALILIALTANGSGAAADWPAALASLTRIAQTHPTAGAQMAMLDAMTLDQSGWPAVSDSPTVRSSAPHVVVFEQFLNPAECKHLAVTVQDILEPSQVVEPRTGRLIAHPIRTSSAALIGPTRESLPIQAILRRIAAATSTAVEQGESLAVLHYAPGQQYREHVDTLPQVTNQRIGTFIIYLNEGYSGGQTRFPAANLTISARMGDAVYFRNVTPDGQPDLRSRHAGLPVTAGAKWIATRWIRQRPIDVWNPD